jgi:hypothetical protein
MPELRTTALQALAFAAVLLAAAAMPEAASARQADPPAAARADLVHLAVVRDARPDAQLTYRVVDNGRAREHRYAVSAQKEGITVNGIDYLAMRVQRTDQDDEQTVFWIADGVPTPIRILEREDGKDVYDLQLVQYQGA